MTIKLGHRIAIIMLSLTAAPLATGQATTTSAQPPGGSGFAAAGLEETAFTAETLGLTLHPPRGAVVTTANADGQSSVAVSDPGESTTWRMLITRIYYGRSRLRDEPWPVPADLVNRHLKDLDERQEPYRVLDDRDLVAGDRTGRLLYLQLPTRLDGRILVKGWFVLPRPVSQESREYLICSITAHAEVFHSMRSVLTSCLETIRLRSTEDMSRRLESRLRAGRAIVESIDEAALRSCVGYNRWFRHFKPAAGDGSIGDSELGYSYLEVIEAKRGRLNPDRPEDSYDPAEHEVGLMVRVGGRVVVNSQRGVYNDWVGLFWLAWDRSTEAWSVRATYRRGESRSSLAETGVRVSAAPGSNMSKLHVVKSSGGGLDREDRSWQTPDIYLSQAETWIIGTLLSRRRPTDLEYEVYAYDPITVKLSRRIDTLQPLAPGSNQWVFTSQPDADAEKVTSIYSSSGDLVQRRGVDGSVTLPIELRQLRALWRSHGLKLGRIGG